MKKIIEETTFFKLLFITYMFLRTLALGYFNINIDIFSLFILGYGFILVIYHLIKKTIHLTKYHYPIILYSIILILSTLLNPISQFSSYIIALMQLIISLLIFTQPKYTTFIDIEKEQRLLIPYTCFLVMMASTLSLVMFFMNYSSYKNGWVLGISGGRLFGVYFNCNPASFLAIMIILLSFIAIKKNYPHKFLYFLNIGIQFSYILLTQCRSAILILSIIALSLIYYRLFYNKCYSKIKTLFLKLLLCFSIILGSLSLNKLASLIPELQGVVVQSHHRFQFDKIKEILSLTFSGDATNFPKALTLLDQVSSGRIDLLKSSYHIWQTSPLIGIGADNFRNQLIEFKQTDKGIGQQITHTHHLFIESLVTTGIIGFVVFILFLLKSLQRIFKTFKKNTSHSTYFILFLYTLIVLTEFVGSLFDFGVFYTNSLSSTLFWLFLGYLTIDYS